MTNIKVFFYENKEDICGFEVTGHTDYGNSGEDIVCSAISVLTQTAIYGLTRVAKLKAKYLVKEGQVLCMIPQNIEKVQHIEAQAILKTMYIGLLEIRDQYSKHISIIEKRRCH